MAFPVRLIAVATAFIALAELAVAQGPPLKSAGAQFCRKALRPHRGIDPAAVQWTMGFVYAAYRSTGLSRLIQSSAALMGSGAG